MQKVDIIIKSWNAIEYTLLTIQSVKDNTEIPFRIVVIDDGSSDETIKRLQEVDNITLVMHGTNKGSAKAAITGFQNTDSELFVLMDSDIVVTKEWLSKLIIHMKDPNIAVVSPLRYGYYKYPNTDLSSRSVWEEIKNKHQDPRKALQLFLKGLSLENFGNELANFNRISDSIIECPPAFVSTSCVLLRRSLVKKAGGIMSPEFSSYGEDVDLCWRLGLIGSKILRSSKVYVHHFEHSSVIDNKIDSNFLMNTSNQILYYKWGSMILDLEPKLLKKYSQSKITMLFPFIKLFNEIRNKGYGKIF